MTETQELEFRIASPNDLQLLYDVAAGMGASKAAHYFEESLERQKCGERNVFLAFWGKDLAGYGMLSWAPKYGFYRAHGIPEIQDLNVLPAFRGRGIASALIAHCEKLARDKGCEYMGIGVGLTPSYGAAQKLYVRLGYVPDGYGVTYDRKTLQHGEFRPIDDDLSLMFVKPL